MLPDFLSRMRGFSQGRPPRVSRREIWWSWFGSFIGVAALALIGEAWFDSRDIPLMLASFGASAVLVYGMVRSPLAQPRNLIGGHVLSAAIGVACWKLLHTNPWLAEAMAVATSIAVMHATRTLHPPGGGTALIAVIGSPQIHDLGFLYVLVPGAIGPAILLVIALVVNNVPRDRRYPEIWF
jgi:CBS-domain-containing membrane protein